MCQGQSDYLLGYGYWAGEKKIYDVQHSSNALMQWLSFFIFIVVWKIKGHLLTSYSFINFNSFFPQTVWELPASNSLNFDIHWYPKVPGVISASSFDVKIGIYNIEVMPSCTFFTLGSYNSSSEQLFFYS